MYVSSFHDDALKFYVGLQIALFDIGFLRLILLLACKLDYGFLFLNY